MVISWISCLGSHNYRQMLQCPCIYKYSESYFMNVEMHYRECRNWWRLQNTHKLINLRALTFSPVKKYTSCNVWVRYFVWNCKGHTPQILQKTFNTDCFQFVDLKDHTNLFNVPLISSPTLWFSGSFQLHYENHSMLIFNFIKNILLLIALITNMLVYLILMTKFSN